MALKKHLLSYQRKLLFFGFLFLAGCTTGSWSQDKDIKNKCAVENFSLFMEDFLISINEQIKYTKIPLQKLYVDPTTDPEPSLVEVKLDLDQIVFPVFPKKEDLKKIGVTINSSTSGKNAEIRLSKPDTDYLVIYFFRHQNCWSLFRIEDWSL